MNSLDYTTIKVVGVVEPHTNGIHAYLRVIGYIDPDTGWKFKRLYPDEIKEKFPTRGLIFMPNFLKKYRNLCGQCIYTGIQVSNNEGHDQFIWDRDAGLPAEYGVVVCEEKLRQKDPEGIYETLSGYQDTTYFHDGPFLYRYTPKTGQPYYYIEQWDLNNILSINQDRIICYDRDRSRYVIMNDNIAGTATYLDIMPDEQLKEWFVETYVTKAWSSILQNENRNKLLSEIKNTIPAKGVPNEVLESRITRISLMFENFLLNARQIQALAENPLFKECIDRSVAKYSEQLITNLQSQYKREYQSLQSEQKERVAQLEREVNTATAKAQAQKEKLEEEQNQYQAAIKQQLAHIVSNKKKIETLENSLQKITNEKDRILKDCDVLRDIIVSLTSNHTHLAENGELLTVHNESQPIQSKEELESRLRNGLRNNNRRLSLSNHLISLLAYNHVLLIPDHRIVNAIIQATGNCCYMLEDVTPKWQTFEYVWANGLKRIVEHSWETPNEMHYYVLRNINISYLPCYLQPVVDMILKLRCVFPGSILAFPGNLRIILVPTEDAGLPLATQCIRYFGCLPKTDTFVIAEDEEYRIVEKIDTEGYLTPGLLNSLLTQVERPDPEAYKSYVTEDE